MDLIIRPSDTKELYTLQLRHNDGAETEYFTIKDNITKELAISIIEAGAPFWLFGKPEQKWRQE